MSHRTIPDDDLAKMRVEIDEFANRFELTNDEKDTARVVIAALFVGTDTDLVAKVTGLNRDKFVRPKAKKLRENGIWVGNQVCMESNPEDESDENFMTEILLHVLVANGLVEREPAKLVES